jgi:hypothetical protein
VFTRRCLKPETLARKMMNTPLLETGELRAFYQRRQNGSGVRTGDAHNRDGAGRSARRKKEAWKTSALRGQQWKRSTANRSGQAAEIERCLPPRGDGAHARSGLRAAEVPDDDQTQ